MKAQVSKLLMLDLSHRLLKSMLRSQFSHVEHRECANPEDVALMEDLDIIDIQHFNSVVVVCFSFCLYSLLWRIVVLFLKYLDTLLEIWV